VQFDLSDHVQPMQHLVDSDLSLKWWVHRITVDDLERCLLIYGWDREVGRDCL